MKGWVSDRIFGFSDLWDPATVLKSVPVPLETRRLSTVPNAWNAWTSAVCAFAGMCRDRISRKRDS